MSRIEYTGIVHHDVWRTLAERLPKSTFQKIHTNGVTAAVSRTHRGTRNPPVFFRRPSASKFTAYQLDYDDRTLQPKIPIIRQ